MVGAELTFPSDSGWGDWSFKVLASIMYFSEPGNNAWRHARHRDIQIFRAFNTVTCLSPSVNFFTFAMDC
ncbi:hypothetical protein BDR22DRAFT_864529 [Usnea florida]